MIASAFYVNGASAADALVKRADDSREQLFCVPKCGDAARQRKEPFASLFTAFGERCFHRAFDAPVNLAESEGEYDDDCNLGERTGRSGKVRKIFFRAPFG